MKKKFLSYSAEYDLVDLIIFNVFKDFNMKECFYIDIGANDPWEGSVTKTLYDMGWHGINVEPLEPAYERLTEDRPRDINVWCGVGEEGMLTLYVAGPNGRWSSFDKTVSERLRKMGVAIEEKKVPVIPFSTICETHLPKGQEVHFCKIDTEGYEEQVLKTMDLKQVRPWVITLEFDPAKSASSSNPVWEHMLLEQNYSFVFTHGLNRYYIDQSKIFLKENFVKTETLKEEYEILKAVPLELGLAISPEWGTRKLLKVLFDLPLCLLKSIRTSIFRRIA